ncbi:MAG: MotA/TolQ/ExbB proton channel family protein [Gammaproteobacteria bacterium]|nr:MotA/TolQ/ExbB proton channel family protein [Gammaproteobacteria bacterium]MCY3815151.1 MotA/TolQ/ExbB proton channel family protein [Gammaproteobacteria bacterium]MYJ75698.1 MotA/TolQ/ExbB proton channel family protein [Gammaproteobacteria bacterium]
MFNWFYDAFEAIRDFVELGGDVLFLIALTIFVMWLLVFERLVFYGVELKNRKTSIYDAWEARAERQSWQAHRIRERFISEYEMGVRRSLPLVQTLVALCPLLGLLGTVTGMIEVFDVMAVEGSGNPRSMASGVSKATIPTMAGMVGALSGVFWTTYLNRRAAREVEDLEEHLTMDH